MMVFSGAGKTVGNLSVWVSITHLSHWAGRLLPGRHAPRGCVKSSGYGTATWRVLLVMGNATSSWTGYYIG
ncbi:MAG: hypothetical protein GF384_00790 [Elusimicrobia bacterium]|nr:hypothetical protein [Elusimicrobiota bacterium]